jgi:hypothetical protein
VHSGFFGFFFNWTARKDRKDLSAQEPDLGLRAAVELRLTSWFDILVDTLAD